MRCTISLDGDGLDLAPAVTLLRSERGESSGGSESESSNQGGSGGLHGD